jgi:hypothetical protein
MAQPKFVVHTVTVVHKEYVVTANTAEEITEEWLALLPCLKEEVICDKITHTKCINEYEYHTEYNSGMKSTWNDPVEGSRYELERGKEE